MGGKYTSCAVKVYQTVHDSWRESKTRSDGDDGGGGRKMQNGKRNRKERELADPRTRRNVSTYEGGRG